MNRVSRSFAATVDSLEPIRDFITEQSSTAGVDRKKNYALCLAIDEIATNIIKYGYPLKNIADGEGTIGVTISREENRFIVVLEDTAIPFNPLQHTIPDEDAINKPLEERSIGGLGILIAQKSVDEFNYEFVNNTNRNIFILNIL